MLRGKGQVSACSLSSCRVRAEALARAFNSRIWPCGWIQSPAGERADGMANGVDDEEEFFDASPSPVEIEDEQVICKQHSSAATPAGRAQLYKLLQQHANDDAIDVFYDVSEDAGPAKVSKDSEHPSGKLESSASDINSSELAANTCAENGLSCADSLLKHDENGTSGVGDELLDHQSATTVCPRNDSSKIHNGNCEAFLPQNDDLPPEQRAPIEENGAVRDTGEVSKSVENESEWADDTEAVDVLDNQDTTISHQNDNCTLTENESCDVCFPQSLSPEESMSCDRDDLYSSEVNNQDVVKIEVSKDSESSDASDAKTPSPSSSRLQVFEELRPKISRSTSLKTGKTPPGTPSRKKIVRFADVLGLDLEDVKHIMTGDIPVIPMSAYTDLDLKDSDLLFSEPISETIEVQNTQSTQWQCASSNTAANVLYPQFTIPGEHADFLDKVRSQGICLETLTVSDVNVQCTCRVMNLGFAKKVTVRYSTNDWLSSVDIDASYVQGSSNGETDNFSFSIFLSPLNRSLKFALKYHVNGKEYWDNNGGLNYCLGYHGGYPMQHVNSPTWQHQF